MVIHPMRTPNLRLLLPETLWLESEHFEQAREIINRLAPEPQQWQAYLNVLALFTFEAWLQEWLPNHPIYPIAYERSEVSYLGVGDFKLCLIATEQVLDEVASVPKEAVEHPELAAHFYILLEVLEDQEQVVTRGFWRYDELIAQSNRIAASQTDGRCLLPLSVLDPELNHLVFYIQYSESSAIPLPTVSTQVMEDLAGTKSDAIRTVLSQWLHGSLDEGWQTIDTLISPTANLAWSARNPSSDPKGGKLINFGVQLGHQTVVLLVTVSPDSEGKIGVNIQVLPTGGEQRLPSQLKLTLLSSRDKILQEIQTRKQDNYIQLRPFKGKPATRFSIEVGLNDIKVREGFEL